MTAVWPFLAASCRAVPKMLSVAWTSAPALRSALTVAVSPFRAASCRTSPNAGLVLARIMMTTTVCVRNIFMRSPWSRRYARSPSVRVARRSWPRGLGGFQEFDYGGVAPHYGKG